jgi:hypothetical protein
MNKPLLIPLMLLVGIGLAACDGTADRRAPAPPPVAPPPPPPVLPINFQTFVVDLINNSTNATGRPVSINELLFEIDEMPIDLDLFLG